MQRGPIRVIDQINHRRMLRILGGTQPANRFVQHQVQRALRPLDNNCVETHLVKTIRLRMAVAHYRLINPNSPGRNRQYSGDASHFRMPGHQTVEFHRCGRLAYSAVAGKHFGPLLAERWPDNRWPTGAAPREWGTAVKGVQVNSVGIAVRTVRTVRTVTGMV